MACPDSRLQGSDDHHVKIWDINSEKAVATIESKANVCCVKFNPDSSNYSMDSSVFGFSLPCFVFGG